MISQIGFFQAAYAAIREPTAHLPVVQGRAEEGTDVLLDALFSVLSIPIENHIENRNLSFASPDSLEYADNVADVQRLSRHRTTVLQHLELSHSRMADLAKEITDSLGRRVSISAYISEPSSEAFGWHIDKWDGIIWQLHGKKIFDLKEQPSISLAPGSLLYLREGVVHRAKTTAQSIHLSIVISSQSAYERD